MSRTRFVIFIVFLATVMGAAMWIGGSWKHGLAGFLIVLVPWLIISFAPWGGFENLRPGPQDERQDSIASEAQNISGMVLIYVALAGAVWDIAQGKTNSPYVLMCAVGGASFLAAMVILPRRR